MTEKVHRGNGTSFGPSIISRNDPWTGASNPGTGETKKYDYYGVSLENPYVGLTAL